MQLNMTASIRVSFIRHWSYNSLIAFNIELMDHIIIGNMEYKSVFEHIEELCQNARQITDDRTKNQVVE